MKKTLLAVLVSLSSFAQANEALPVQKVEPPKTTAIPAPQETNKPVVNQEDTLTDIEKANIKDIYNRKLDNPQFEMGIRYYTGSNGLKVDYDKAIYWFSNSSKDENNPKADMMLAVMYYQGQGFTQDKQKALNFYQRAGNRGSIEAQLILTGIYFFSMDSMNQEMANYWIYKAIEQKNTIAEALKSVILLNANDAKSVDKLIPLYENLADHKDPIASFMLGYFYFTGKFKDQSFEKAEPYLSLAAENGNPVAVVMLEEIMKFSDNTQVKK